MKIACHIINNVQGYTREVSFNITLAGRAENGNAIKKKNVQIRIFQS